MSDTNTMQQVYDAIKAFVATKPPKAQDEDGACRYRTSTGTKCFIGALIRDEDYYPELEDALPRDQEMVDVLNKAGYSVKFCYCCSHI